jgi:hypothetical protein
LPPESPLFKCDGLFPYNYSSNGQPKLICSQTYKNWSVVFESDLQKLLLKSDLVLYLQVLFLCVMCVMCDMLMSLLLHAGGRREAWLF